MSKKSRYNNIFNIILTSIALILSIGNTFAAKLQMAMPLDCEYGVNCYVQNYVDLNKNPELHTDYKCGNLSYDDHKGTDFRLLDFSELRKGYKVLAVADGTIKAIRTNEPDFAYLEKKHKLIENKECGNGIVLQHSDNYSTQYCHMLKDSITVKENQEVKKGQVLGFVGVSGKTEFPHLHITVKKFDKVIDPFSGIETNENYNCDNTNQSNNRTLWDEETSAKLKYIDTAILNFYTTTKVPTQFLARAGQFRENSISQDSKNIILWADIMGVQKNDSLLFEIIDAKGNSIFKSNQEVPKKYVLYFIYVGERLNKEKFSKGEYTTKITISRDNKIIDSKSKSVLII